MDRFYILLCLMIAIATAALEHRNYTLVKEPNVANLEVFEGQPLRISCSVEDVSNDDTKKEDLKLFWKRGNEKPKPPSIEILNATFADSGVYTCNAEYDSWDNTTTINVTILPFELLNKIPNVTSDNLMSANVKSICQGDSCAITWVPQTINGTAIANYTILVSQPNATDETGFAPPLFNETTYKPAVSFSPLANNATYKLRFFVTNANGTWKFADYTLKPNATPRSMLWFTGLLLGLVFLLLLFACCLIFFITKKWRNKRYGQLKVPRAPKV